MRLRTGIRIAEERDWNKLKIAIAHEWLTNMAGSEACVLNFCRIFKEAPIFTTVYNPDAIDPEIKSHKIITSFLQFGRKRVTGHQKYFPLMPLACNLLNAKDYDVILSSSHCCIKGLRKKKDAVHISYCHTPMRYAWVYEDEYCKNMKPFKKALVKILLAYMRWWDFRQVKNVDYFIANSTLVKERIKKYYKRDAVVIPPPVRCSRFSISEKIGDYYLAFSRLVPYKRFDIAVEACSELGKKLIVIGDGPEKERLEKLAAPCVTFLGYQNDDTVNKYVSECKALLFPGEEDFGIVPVEVMAAGRPVIAYGKGGVLDSIIDGKTGVFFKEQTVGSLVDAINQFETMDFDPDKIREHALLFDENVFQKKIKTFVTVVVNKQMVLK